MDAFYASVEQRENPSLKGRPVVVGGSPCSRGVVAACSYEARKFGIRSAMPSARAFSLCKDAVFIRPRFDLYKRISEQIRDIFSDYTPVVEPLSLDEAFLDVTDCILPEESLQKRKENLGDTILPPRYGPATGIALEILGRIHKKTGLTASSGVSFNKFLAKVASDVNKPNGIFVIPPELADGFIERLPIGKFFGVGRVTEEKMKRLGICTGKDLRRYKRHELVQLFGKNGNYYYEIAHGLDKREVNPVRIRKSMGKEITLDTDLADMESIQKVLASTIDSLEAHLLQQHVKGRTITIKIRYNDFSTITRSVTQNAPVGDSSTLFEIAVNLLKQTEAGRRPVRLVGVSLSSLVHPERKSMQKTVQTQLVFPFEKEFL